MRTVCQVIDCGRPEQAKGMCQGHYSRQRHWGELRPEVPLQERYTRGLTCATEGCDRLTKAKGRCNAHYNRMRLTGDDRPNQPIKPIRYDWDDECSVDRCDNAARKLGRCEMHYSRWRATGTDERPDQCSVCDATGLTVWDHCHSSGQFRGWLCTRCNLILGSVKDDPELLKLLADYLEKQGVSL